MPKPPRQKPRYPDEFDREDELQEYQITAARLRDASPETIQRCTKERWDKYRSKKKRQEPSRLTKEQFLDCADWDCFRDGVGEEDDAILAYDLERAYESACRVYPKPVVLAAMDLLTATEAIAACRVRTEKVCRQIEDARALLRELLADYRER